MSNKKKIKELEDRIMPSKETLYKVIDASARTYRISGHRVCEASKDENEFGLGIYIPELKRLEYAYSPNVELPDIPNFSEYRRNGLEIWILFPLSFMGEACDQFRGKVDIIQSWWQEDGKFKFGTPSIP